MHTKVISYLPCPDRIRVRAHDDLLAPYPRHPKPTFETRTRLAFCVKWVWFPRELNGCSSVRGEDWLPHGADEAVESFLVVFFFFLEWVGGWFFCCCRRIFWPWPSRCASMGFGSVGWSSSCFCCSCVWEMTSCTTTKMSLSSRDVITVSFW